AAIAASDWDGRVVPTFRPDALVHIDRPTWKRDVEELGEVAGVAVDTYAGYIAALEQRREHFRKHGALATDHGHTSADTTPLDRADAERIYAAALAGSVEPAAAEAFAAHMLFEMARMSRDDGLVMQIHPGVARNHHAGVHDAFGPDKGFDIPLPVDFTRGLQPMLSAFGTDPGFRCVVFTIDETTYSRELAPLAGVYPSMRLGVPWWFLDSPHAMRRFREAVTETAGFYNTAGFVDDTRAFASIPARHPRVGVRSRPPRPGPPRRQRLPRPARGDRPARARGGAGDGRRPLGDDPAAGVRPAPVGRPRSSGKPHSGPERA